VILYSSDHLSTRKGASSGINSALISLGELLLHLDEPDEASTSSLDHQRLKKFHDGKLSQSHRGWCQRLLVKWEDNSQPAVA